MMPPILLDGAESRPIDDTLAFYGREGYARLGLCIHPEMLEMLRARTDAIMMGEVVYPGLFFQLDTTSGRYDDLEVKKGYQGPSKNYRKLEKLEKDPLFFALLSNPLFLKIARALLEPPITIYRSIVMSKAAEGGTYLPWHQDGGRFWGLSEDPKLQIWVALDDAEEDAGCVEVLPKTHLGGLASPLGGVIPEQVLLEAEAEQNALRLPAKAGECLLIHNYVWHRSLANRTGHPRRAFSTCYMSHTTKCMRKRHAPREFQVVG